MPGQTGIEVVIKGAFRAPKGGTQTPGSFAKYTDQLFFQRERAFTKYAEQMVEEIIAEGRARYTHKFAAGETRRAPTLWNRSMFRIAMQQDADGKARDVGTIRALKDVPMHGKTVPVSPGEGINLLQLLTGGWREHQVAPLKEPYMIFPDRKGWHSRRGSLNYYTRPITVKARSESDFVERIVEKHAVPLAALLRSTEGAGAVKVAVQAIEGRIPS